MIEKLGVDIGGVLIDRINDNTDTSFFGDNYLKTTTVPNAFESVKRLAAARFGDEVHLVSKCGPNIERKSREWLAHHDFHAETGVPPERMHFCRRRQDKAPICKSLGLTHFIDDRLEVLSYLKSVPHLFLFMPRPAEVKRHARHLKRVHRVESWAEVLAALL